MKMRFSEDQIIAFLREAEAGLQVKEMCRRQGFSEALRNHEAGVICFPGVGQESQHPVPPAHAIRLLRRLKVDSL